MKKIFVYTFVGVLGCMLTACSGENKTTNETVQTDSAETVGSVMENGTDSPVEQPAEVVDKAEKSKEGDRSQKKEVPAQSANSKKIDKLLKEYQKVVRDIRNNFYVNGEFFPNGHAYYDLAAEASRLNKQLKGLQGEMTSEQKSKFKKLTAQIKNDI